MASDETVCLIKQEDMNVVSDAESVIEDLPIPMTEVHEDTSNDEVEPQGKIFSDVFGEILAGLKSGTYKMIMITGDTMMNSRQKVKNLKKRTQKKRA